MFWAEPLEVSIALAGQTGREVYQVSMKEKSRGTSTRGKRLKQHVKMPIATVRSTQLYFRYSNLHITGWSSYTSLNLFKIIFHLDYPIAEVNRGALQLNTFRLHNIHI